MLWHHAIQEVGAGLATVLGNTQVVIVPIAAWLLLGERPARASPHRCRSCSSASCSSPACSATRPSAANPVLGVVFGIATGLAYAGFLLVQRRANADPRRPAGPLFDATMSAADRPLLIGLPLGRRRPRSELAGRTAGCSCSALSVQVVGWLLISISLPRLPAAVTSVVLTIQPVGSVLLGIWILNEAPCAFQLLGVVFILAGRSRRRCACDRPRSARSA